MTLHALWRGCGHAAPGACRRHLASLERFVEREVAEPHFEAAREHLFPVYRPVGSPSPGPEVLRAPAPEGLEGFISFEEGAFCALVTERQAGAWGMGPAALMALALHNLDRVPATPRRHLATPLGLRAAAAGEFGFTLLSFEAGDGYDAARPFARAHQALLAAHWPGGWFAALPSPSFALLAPEGEPEGEALLTSIARAEGERTGFGSALFTLPPFHQM